VGAHPQPENIRNQSGQAKDRGKAMAFNGNEGAYVKGVRGRLRWLRATRDPRVGHSTEGGQRTDHPEGKRTWKEAVGGGLEANP